MKKHILLLAFTLGLSACSMFHDRLLFIEESHIGLKAKVSPDNTAPVDIDFGYRRSILTLIPKASTESDQKSQVNPAPSSSQQVSQPNAGKVDFNPNESLSVISSFNANVRWFDATIVHTYFATGEAATNTAKFPEAIKALVTKPTKED